MCAQKNFPALFASSSQATSLGRRDELPLRLTEMTPQLCRTARALLDWTQKGLGERSGTSLDTVKYYETGRRIPLAANRAKIQNVLEVAGIVFIEEGSQRFGVTLIGASWASRCRAARCVMGWTHRDVSRAASVSELTVLRLEAEQAPRRATLITIRRALEDAGVIFLDEGGRAGVMIQGAQ